MFCPRCKAEYRQGFYRCADCDVDLVHTLPPEETLEAEPVRKGSLVRLWAGNDLALHGALLEDLSSANIPFFDRPAAGYSGSRRMLGIVETPPNFGYEVQVFSSDLIEAREILRGLEQESHSHRV
jgi:hypothetical protein